MPSALELRVAALEEQVAALLSKGKRTNECVKGHDPSDCPVASTYRYQKGCGGASCKRVNTEYYSDRTRKHGTPVAAPKRRSAIASADAPKRKKVWGGPRTEG